MRFQIVHCEQRTPEWFAARAGRLTGSRAADALAFLKGGKEAAARRDYRLQLSVERMTGIPQDDTYVSKEMQRGIDLEPKAREAYEGYSGHLVRRTGFVKSLELPVGASLDGDVHRMKGLVEIKCPKSATHVSYIEADVVPEDYLPQVRHGAWVTGAEWVDFVSFDDRLQPELQLFVKRIYAKDMDLPGYEKEALKFLAEVGTEISKLEDLVNRRRKPADVQAAA